MNASVSIAAPLVVPLALVLWTRSLAMPRPSPSRTVIVFALGALSIVLAGLLASLIDGAGLTAVQNPYLAGLSESFFEAALPEEVVRLVVVTLALALARRQSGPSAGLAFGAAAGSGFAASEGALGVMGGESVLTIALGRSLGAVGHACYGMIMGYHLGRAWTGAEGRLIHGGLALALPVVLHTFYDFPVLTVVPGAETAIAGDQMPPWPALVLMVISPMVFVAEVTLAIHATRRARTSVPQVAGSLP